ncbi:MAG: hypothetical protein WCX65_03465 [bacterium]
MRNKCAGWLFAAVAIAVLFLSGTSVFAAATKPAAKKPAEKPAVVKPAPAAAVAPAATPIVDEAKVIKQIKDTFVCNSGSTITESEAEGGKCPNGDYVIGVVQRLMAGKGSESDFITLAKYFPQGRSMVTSLPTASCAKDGKLQLDFFIMSYCPYGVRFVDGALTEMINKLGDTVEWTPYFILDRDESGKLASMHGQKEVDEDLRMICIREKFGRKKWLSYAGCFSREVFSKPQGGKDWKECALAVDINPDEIDKCMATEANKFAEKDMAQSQTYNANGSPTAVYNCNKQIVGAIPFEQIKAQVCKLIPGEKPAACK